VGDVEGAEFVQDVVPALDAGMAKDLASGPHLEGAAAEAEADSDVDIARVLALAGPACGQGLEVVIAHDQGFAVPVIVQGQGNAVVLAGGDVARRRLKGPVEDGLDGALLEADAGLAEGVT
jgi:hypothetical protein